MRTTTLALVALLTACGGKDYCDRIAKDAEACGDEISDADLQECKDGIASCSKDDMKKLDEFYDCAKDAGLFECETGSDTGFGSSSSGDFAAAMACIAPLMDLSEECGAFGSTSSSYTYSYSGSTSSAE